MGQEFTPDQMEKLLRYASKRLNTTPEALTQAFQQNGLLGLAQQAQDSGLSPEDAARAQEMLQDRRQAEKLLEDPQIRELLQRLLRD